MAAHIFCIFIFAWVLIGIVMAVSVAMSFIRKYERSEERVIELELRLGSGERVTPPNILAPHFMARFWHGKDRFVAIMADFLRPKPVQWEPAPYSIIKAWQDRMQNNIIYPSRELLDQMKACFPMWRHRMLGGTRRTYADEIMPGAQRD